MRRRSTSSAWPTPSTRAALGAALFEQYEMAQDGRGQRLAAPLRWRTARTSRTRGSRRPGSRETMASGVPTIVRDDPSVYDDLLRRAAAGR